MAELDLDDELVHDYLAECREHLATIEADLLTIEQCGADADEKLVNRVFRAAHSIKGGAGFFDLGKIRELAHRTENVLDLLRSRQMIPTPDVVSILLLGFDKLRELLDNYKESNLADITEFVNALTTLTRDNLPADQKSLVTTQVPVGEPDHTFAAPAFDIEQAQRHHRSIYLVEYDLIHDVERKGRTPWQVFRKLIQCGTIVDTFYDLKSAGTLDDEPSKQLILEVLFATTLQKEGVIAIAGVPAERIRQVQDNDPARTSAPQADGDGGPAGMEKSSETEVEIESTAKQEETGETASEQNGIQDAIGPDNVSVAADLRKLDRAQEPSRAASSLARPAAPSAVPSPAGKSSAASTPAANETTIRLNIGLLDSLMTLAGELVLSRNQLNESLARQDQRGIRSGAQRVSLVTSELQEVVTLTRMQPVGSLFGRFPRLVRDLARDLGKEAQLNLEGCEVEIDKTILEGLSDPLTHMVRNAVDHGLECSADRVAAGKTPAGLVTLRASHQAGQVVIEISDDGKGLVLDKIVESAVAKGQVTREQVSGLSDREKMALIFAPGVSTAERISDVSGRGVGMDVVKTNLDRLGGKIEIESIPGRGSRFRIKLPLTLAIIPSLLISNDGQRFAIPQVNVGELIRIPSAQIEHRTDRVGDAWILKLRDRLVPLIYLSDVFGQRRPDCSSRALNVVLVDTGSLEYGLAVEDLHETVEIVVKPLGRHLKTLHDYAGATILGDGRVAVILDVAGLAARAGLSAGAVETSSKEAATENVRSGELHSLLLFRNAPEEICAVPIEQVSRIERVHSGQIEHLGGRRTMQYRKASLPVAVLGDAASVGELSDSQQWVVIVFERLGRPFGLLAAEPLDMVEATLEIDSITLRQPGVAGSAVLAGSDGLKDRTLLILDIFELAARAHPESVCQSELLSPAPGRSDAPTVLVADDSEFFRGQIQRLVEGIGCRVLPAKDGEEAWELLDQHSGEVRLVATDVEMPRMDGLALTRQIRADQRFSRLPVIALSSLAGEEEIARGVAAGVNEYQIKLNREKLLGSIQQALAGSCGK
jgi:two-component system chemotaxis sensor kinase CheA